ncbi:tRNA (N6-threonylcarbamoyladenosine(37)-N6)-methyltransferase TrmO [Colwellia maritima]|uniref:tRNA (N6-threonylcarbamoyladenosine(37)-N6)-methyltransferase n=1 Tax=Colwellia maritima TaxID=2912588 RepID=UPI0030841FE4
MRPPRLGGNKKVGVLASRSTFRPNPIGMSVVKLDKVEHMERGVIIHISGLDLLDQTPIVDIKPYIPYSDALENSLAGFAQQEPQVKLKVTFAIQAHKALEKMRSDLPDLTLLIEQVLSQDPRPAYKQKHVDDKIYGMRLYDLNIQWRMINFDKVEVVKVTPY